MLLLTLLACGKLVTIEVEAEATTTVPQGTLLEALVGALGFGDFTNMDLTAEEELANQGVQPGDIVDARLTAFTLEVVSPAEGDLSFLESLEVWVEAPALSEALVASSAAFAEGARRVDLDLEDLDLTDYVTSASMTLRTEVSGHRPEQDTEVRAAVALDVGVTAQGVRSQVEED